jgi:uncharacterized RDD family membrane protein YckC
MLKLECPFCGLGDIDATSATFCSRCGRRLVGNLEDPYGWDLASDVQTEAGPIDTARVEAPSARAAAVAPVTAVGFWLRMATWGIDMGAIAIAVFLYFTVCNKLGASIGKATLGLKVISVDERPIDWPRATLRPIFWLVGLASLGLGLLWIAWDDKRQGWHDKLSGTMVVKLDRV